ncbi:MAG: gamma carbonic anhydrase family protein [Clostridia bacterium]|jgi:carbonic anhydrase/acetyltransferase-like protein (isoleucine patch superfamily)|nr:gamma carbonic anhydrase family protein [Clostridia bacterium]MCI2000477.1 gamma carbonic anhydrase family protein [Clostridia bacterium]MCI2014932.1 gamma carbonic anhydrase family protein [Clostridia bacterium]
MFTKREYKGKSPKIAESTFIFENVSIYGDVTIGENCVIMPGCVIRGEGFPVVIGDNTNIQDLCCIHTDSADGGIYIGKNVTIGHGAIIHACTIDDSAMVGMGSIVQNRAHIGSFCLIGAGAVVPAGCEIQSGYMALGVPAKEKRPVSEAERKDIFDTIKEYKNLAEEYLK